MTTIDYSTLSKEDAEKLMHEKVSEAYAALAEAKLIADAHWMSFDFSPCYGMGGYYNGAHPSDDGTEDDDDDGYYGEHGWNPSSQSC